MKTIYPPSSTIESLRDFLHESLKPYQDTPEDIQKALYYALASPASPGGFVILAQESNQVLGAVVVLGTGMSGYVPSNILLFVAVSPDCRGQGVGKTLCEMTIRRCNGDISLHVEYDNPAKRLYERLGFVSKYAEMRHSR